MTLRKGCVSASSRSCNEASSHIQLSQQSITYITFVLDIPVPQLMILVAIHVVFPALQHVTTKVDSIWLLQRHHHSHVGMCWWDLSHMTHLDTSTYNFTLSTPYFVCHKTLMNQPVRQPVRLLVSQLPALSNEPLQHVSTSWSNIVFSVASCIQV